MAPRGEARSDLQIVFDLATRLGLGTHFGGGDIDAAFRHQLAPSGITPEDLRAHPEGVRDSVALDHDVGVLDPPRRPASSRVSSIASETLKTNGTAGCRRDHPRLAT